MTDLSSFKIHRLAVHELPKDGAKAGVLSEVQTPLHVKVRHFFEERIRAAIGTAGVPITFATGASATVRAAVEAIAGASDAKKSRDLNFMTQSKAIASHLIGMHSSSYSEGLICVADAELRARSAVAIVKLELQAGVRAELKGVGAKRHFEIKMLDDLMLTDNTKVFKVALFLLRADGYFDGEACDHQRARIDLISQYFLREFLGCTLAQRADVATRDFFFAAEAFFNSDSVAGAMRAQYHAALLAEMNSNNASIGIKPFADTHLRSPDRTPFVAAMRAADVQKMSSKDTTMIASRLARTRLDYDGDLSLLLRPGDDRVTMEPSADGSTSVAFHATLQEVKGAR